MVERKPENYRMCPVPVVLSLLRPQRFVQNALISVYNAETVLTNEITHLYSITRHDEPNNTLN